MDSNLSSEKRICSECGQEYSVEEILDTSPGYWDHPYNYAEGSAQYCLACWLGVGPKDIAKMDLDSARHSKEPGA